MLRVLLLLSLVAAFDGAPVTGQGRAVQRVVIVPDTLRLEIGDTSRAAVCRPLNGHGTLLANPCSWSTLDPTIVSVTSGTQMPRVIALKAGVARLRASAKGKADTSVVLVAACSRTAALGAAGPLGVGVVQTTVAPSLLTLSIGGSATLQAQSRDDCGPLPTPTWTWTARTAGVVTMTGTTKSAITVTGAAPGTSYIVVASGGDSDSMFATVTGTVSGCTSTATNLCPGDDLATKVAAQGTFTTFTLYPGTYRLQSIGVKTGMTFRGVPTNPKSVVLTGAKDITSGWALKGSLYARVVATTWNTDRDVRTCRLVSNGADADYACNAPEYLWVDSVRYDRMAAKSWVTAGSTRWYADTLRDSLFIGTNPTGHVVEMGSAKYAFGGTGTDVRIVGVSVERYAPGAGHGAIGYTQTGGWVVDSSRVRHNSGSGVRTATSNSRPGVQVRWTRIERNGLGGMNGPAGDNMLVYADTFVANHVGNYASGGGDAAYGGIKYSRGTNTIVRRSVFDSTDGTAIWCDISCVAAVWDSNVVRFNKQRGLDSEISFGVTIAYNYVEGNGADLAGQASAAGIWIAQTSDAWIHHNQLVNNVVGIMGTDRDRGSDPVLGLRQLKNMLVENNEITQTTGEIAGGIQSQSSPRDPWSAGQNNRYQNNHYICNGGTVWKGVNNVNVGRAAWQAQGYDTGASGATFTGC